MVMDGAGIRIGAVANLHRIKDAARLALAVMNYTKHTMLVGEAATKFAIEMGFKEQNLSTTFSSEMFSEWKRNKCQPNFWMNVEPDPTKTCGPYRPQNYRYSSLQRNVEIINRFHHDTLGMVVVDSNGNVSAGTSTNGARFKIPGRVGDSPIPGAGAYAVEGVGGAAATGDGDVIMRFLPSFFVVEQIRLGTKPFKATRKAVNRILEHYPHFQGAVVGVNSNGTYGAACANLGSFMFSIGEHGKTRTELVACINKKNSFKKRKKTKHNIVFYKLFSYKYFYRSLHFSKHRTVSVSSCQFIDKKFQKLPS
ncbi:asparaginase [Dictyocaulus viviparus]|uniref:N(4)-(beta-N-acetylglucosaminyl)-L-asparaginase n=1 Tax=Dictyocaulus viviparus TaxID=29172 RepID=A0A0D8XE04_DICVI|nr:asparaginase [Dictyocaulus viviparus]